MGGRVVKWPLGDCRFRLPLSHFSTHCRPSLITPASTTSPASTPSSLRYFPIFVGLPPPSPLSFYCFLLLPVPVSGSL